MALPWSVCEKGHIDLCFVIRRSVIVGTRELLEQARKLDPAERLELVDAVLQSLDQPDPTIDHVWLEEAERRLAAYRAGKVRGVPAEDIFGTT
jgi:putative addiction module component (TIGR02574 family)